MKEDHVLLAKRIEVGVLADEALKLSLDRSPLEIRELRILRATGKKAYHDMIVCNVRLVFFWSKGAASTLSLDWAQDAFQAGCIGLMRAIQGWDWRRDTSFSTYAAFHIRQAIQRWRANEVNIVRVPVHALEAYRGAEEHLRRGRPFVEVARALGVESAGLLAGLAEELPWDGGLFGAEQHADAETFRAFAATLLTERQWTILTLRYGIGTNSLTLADVGGALGVTRERVRQIQSRAEDILRSELARSGRSWVE